MHKNLFLLFATSALLSAGGLTAGPAPEAEAEATGGWTPLFNGTDLAGWKADNPDKFRVENGQLIGSQDDGKGGNLFTLERFDNFELRFSYRAKWPANSGIWFRDSYQFDILKYEKPKTFSGAFYYPNCPGTFAWVNPDEDLENQDGWNEGQIYANGNSIAFWLNGKKIGEKTLVEGTDRIFREGRIGIQVHGGNFQGMEIALRSIEIRKLQPGDPPTPPAAPKTHAAPGSSTPFRTGDRVALVGGGLFERARLNGHIETSLQLAAGNGVDNLAFRNLGWSGDSVFNDARSYFDKPQEGRRRLRQNIAEWQPQVILLNYGAGAALSVDQGWTNEPTAAARSAGPIDESLAVFLEGYQQLIDAIREEATDPAREIVIVSPPPLENLGPPLPDQTANNRRLARFRDALRDLAKTNQLRFVDLFARLGGDDFSGEIATAPLTTDGLHFSDTGYQVLARELTTGLGYQAPAPAPPTAEIITQLRETIVEKNRLFFHRWRPANETYLFLFRKHEQGNNAKEIPQFDPIISERETEIEALRKQILSPIKG